MPSFDTDPEFPGARIWRRPAPPAGSFRSLTAFVRFGGGLLAMITVLAIVMLWTEPEKGVGLLIVEMPAVACIAFLGMLRSRMLQGSRELAIRLTRNAIELTLPAYRAMTHPAPAYHGTIPLRDVRAIETRVECMSQFGVQSAQRTYRLVPRSGEPIFLFAEPLPWTNLEASQTKGLVEEMARHVDLPLTDLGMVRSSAGIMLLWRVRPAPWTAPSLNTAERQVSVAKLNRTAKLMPYAAFAFIVVRVLIGMFGPHS